MNLRRASLEVAAGMLLLASLAGCSSAAAVDAAPVFALDREAASGIAPVDPDRSDVLPAALVRSLLQDLLTEHSDLSVEVMRQAVDGRVERASLIELTKNTDELTVTIGVVYGPEGAAAFDQLWTNHIEFFNDYAAARGAADQRGLAEAITSLSHYESDFSSYIDTATSGEADFHAVLHVLHSHVSQLLEQADAWAERDYDQALALGVEAHRHMDVIANALATGIARQQPQAFTGDPAEALAVACAAKQLDGSTMVGLLGTLAETERDENDAAVAAALLAIDEQRSMSDTAVLAIVDEIAQAGAGSVATPADRTAARDAIRGQIAVGDCASSVVGS